MYQIMDAEWRVFLRGGQAVDTHLMTPTRPTRPRPFGFLSVYTVLFRHALSFCIALAAFGDYSSWDFCSIYLLPARASTALDNLEARFGLTTAKHRHFPLFYFSHLDRKTERIRIQRMDGRIYDAFDLPRFFLSSR